ncbi:DUF7373 family lipoprotein [Nocardia crassostreae]|uniref:DUF7373 family lipoprotein n=1 Tax=Nocardia crassostreae TaxID=53428 RepID=UPI0008329AEB|nr:hypothetical protein [Nocardia crassostreae]
MSRRSFRSTHRLAGCLLAAALTGVAGCAVPGSPVARETDVRSLDAGAYAVDRQTYEQDSHGEGALLEGMRMSEAVATGPRIDATLSVGQGARVITEATEAEAGFLAVGSADVLTRHEFVVGYAAGSSDTLARSDETPSATAVVDFVIRFPSEAAAKVAARDLEDVDFAYAPDQNQRLSLAEFPDAYIHWRPSVATIGAFLPYGPFVVSLFIQRPRADSADLLEWVRKTLDAQRALLDAFRPTATGELDSLLVDPDNLLARVVTAQRAFRRPDPDTFAVYGPSRFVHQMLDSASTERLLTEAGTDRFAVVDSAWILRARDASGATALVNGISASIGTGFDAIDGPVGVPGAKCYARNSRGDPTNAAYRCYVSYKRYAAFVDSEDETDVRQRAAAQYALLANSL